MGDFGRIAKTFYQHPKARKARNQEAGSISLWLFANCWCRSHRREGHISHDEALTLGTKAEIKALVDSGLWQESGDGYDFHDWEDWNPDLCRRTDTASAAYIVWQVAGDHPYAVQKRLATEVQKLADEGMSKRVLVAALEKWKSRNDAPVTWLAYFASDCLREGENGIHAAIKKARSSLDMSGLAEFGFRWQAPDAPDDANTARAIREFMRQQKLQWLDKIEAGLKRVESTTA